MAGGRGRFVRVYGVLLRGTRNREATLAGKLLGVNVFHEKWVGRILLSNHFRIKGVEEGINRAHAVGGAQQRGRRPLSSERC